MHHREGYDLAQMRTVLSPVCIYFYTVSNQIRIFHTFSCAIFIHLDSGTTLIGSFEVVYFPLSGYPTVQPTVALNDQQTSVQLICPRMQPSATSNEVLLSQTIEKFTYILHKNMPSSVFLFSGKRQSADSSIFQIVNPPHLQMPVLLV